MSVVRDRRALHLAELVDQSAVTAIDLEGYLNLDVAQLGRRRQARRDVVIGADEERRNGHRATQRDGQNRQQNLRVRFHLRSCILRPCQSWGLCA